MISLAEKILTAPLGKTHLFSTGQAGFILKSSKGHLLGIDLYLSECVERLEGHCGFKRLLPQILEADELEFDAVICTHPHWDHFDVDTIPRMLSNNRTRLLCSVECEKLVKQLSLQYYNQNITYVSPLEKVTINDFNIEFVNCDHGQGAPDAVGVVVAVDGKRIYETGDTCLRLDRLHEIPTPLDVLIAPINGAYGNLDERDCVTLAENLHPGITIPCHYGMFASHHGDVGKFYNLMEEKKLHSLLMRQGEMLTF